MGVYIPNMEKPKNITRCSYKINPEECKCIYTDKVFEETLALLVDHPCPDCPLIEIDLVRCGECKHLEVINKAPIYAHCHKWDYDFELWQEDTRKSFCSYGERRADGNKRRSV